MAKTKSRKYTICAPDSMSDDLEKSYYILVSIDCNFSRLLQSLLKSIIYTATYILKQKRNFRHYHWHLLIEDKETGALFSTYKNKGSLNNDS